MTKLKYKKYFMFMPDDSVWFVPVSYLAETHARYNSKKDMSDFKARLEDTIKLFNKSEKHIEDWVKNYMSYEQVRYMSEEYERPELSNIQFEEGFNNPGNFVGNSVK